MAAYVDGFNLYYRALRKTAFKWLNVHKLCGSFLDVNQKLVSTKYFTARIKPRPSDPDAPRRQHIYLSALQMEPTLSIHYGRFLPKTKMRPLASDPARFVEILDTEEKGSDVNLASHLLHDAWKDVYDVALVLSQDTDLCEPMRMVSRELHKDVGLIVLDGRAANSSLKRVSTFVRHVNSSKLLAAQFPPSFKGLRGQDIVKPDCW
ncbi:MAG: NYN domain-containing protein [Geminicoccaceae bacterium]